MHTNYGVTMPAAYNDYKPRNILSLTERVKVIHEYNKPLIRPSLQQLAKKFNCSAKQIKNIILNRNSILDLWQEKIVFLDKAMYEYIQRVLYSNYSINEDKFKQKALHIKESIGLVEFQPTQAWVDGFKKTYGIPGFDLYSLRNNLHIKETKRNRLDTIDIIQHVSDMEQESQIDVNISSDEPKVIVEIEDEENEEDEESQKLNVDISTPPPQQTSLSTITPKITNKRRASSPVFDEEQCNTNYSLTDVCSAEPKAIIKIEDEELRKSSICTPTPPPKESSLCTITQKITPKRRVSSPFPDIESFDVALKHLKALEEYAMLHDNFRAIGLLTQLEQVFQKRDKNY